MSFSEFKNMNGNGKYLERVLKKVGDRCVSGLPGRQPGKFSGFNFLHWLIGVSGLVVIRLVVVSCLMFVSCLVPHPLALGLPSASRLEGLNGLLEGADRGLDRCYPFRDLGLPLGLRRGLR